jgi:hypothetical protein
MNKRTVSLGSYGKRHAAVAYTFELNITRGKGGHAMIWVGSRFTTLPSREIDPHTARKIRKQLGLAE